jgi:hypothetical protein
MDKILSAEEWFKKLEDEFLLGDPKSELNKNCKTSHDLIHYSIKAYSTYLLEEFAKEVKSEGQVEWVHEKFNPDGVHVIDKQIIDQLLTKFKEKL